MHDFKAKCCNVENCFFSLQVNGQDLTWNTIQALYEYDLNRNSLTPGYRKLCKLTHDHIFLGPRTRMRVNLAVQVSKPLSLISFHRFRFNLKHFDNAQVLNKHFNLFLGNFQKLLHIVLTFIPTYTSLWIGRTQKRETLISKLLRLYLFSCPGSEFYNGRCTGTLE